jgi:hypothetical protein
MRNPTVILFASVAALSAGVAVVVVVTLLARTVL